MRLALPLLLASLAADGWTWTVQAIDSTGDVGAGTSLSIVNGFPAIAYRDATSQDLKYVRAMDAFGIAWSAPVLVDATGDVGESPSLAVVNGSPAISYYDRTAATLKYVRALDADGSAWGVPVSVATNASATASQTSLAIVAGNPGIAYVDDQAAASYVRSVDASGAAWGAAIPMADPIPSDDFPSLAIANGRPAITYSNGAARCLAYVRASDALGSSWPSPASIQCSGNGSPGRYSSLAIVAGSPACAFRDDDPLNAWAEFKRGIDTDGTSWGFTVNLDGGPFAFAGRYTSLAVIAGNPAVSYFHGPDNDLRYVRANDFAGAAWGSPEVVDAPADVGYETSLAALGPGASAAGVSYYDLTNGDLKYAFDCGVVIAPSSLPGGTLGIPYGQTITANGGTPPYGFSVGSGTLPPGLSLSPAGNLSGTPSAAGTYAFTVIATDATGCPEAHAYAMSICPASCPSITVLPAALPAGVTGFLYSETLTATGGTGSYVLSVVAGTLPPGLTLSQAGVLGGTPTFPGTFSFDIAATDECGCAGQRSYSMIVCPDPCGLTLQPATLPGGTVGAPYTETFTAAGGIPPYVFVVISGALPSGLTLSTSGVISGTPTASGTSSFTVSVSDPCGCVALRSYQVTIAPTPTDYVLGMGLGPPNANEVSVFDASGGVTGVDFFAYAATGYGVDVAAGDVDGAPFAEIVTGPGPSPVYGPQVRAFDRIGFPINKVNFYAYGTLRSGVNVTAGDVDRDGFDEILTGPGPSQPFGPHVRGWNYDGLALLPIAKISLFAYGTLRYGVNVGDSDLDADGYAEGLSGPGPGPAFPATVRAWDFDGDTLNINFNAYTFFYGVVVAGGDCDDAGFGEIGTAPGPGPLNTAWFKGWNWTAGPSRRCRASTWSPSLRSSAGTPPSRISIAMGARSSSQGPAAIPPRLRP
ncbi:MAG: Ig domain-containing protein [Acidobacteriota bacterium]